MSRLIRSARARIIQGFRSKLPGFFFVQIVSMLAPFLLLPVLARSVTVPVWAGISLGQAIGTISGALVSGGWAIRGPSLAARASTETQKALLADCYATRVCATFFTLPVAICIAWLLAPNGAELLAATVAVSVSCNVGYSFAWFYIGRGRPWRMAAVDAAPRTVFLALAAVTIWLDGSIYCYPAAIAVATAISAAATLSVRGLIPDIRSMGRAVKYFADERRLVAAQLLASAYSMAPLPLLAGTSTPGAVAIYSSADKVYRPSLFLISVYANSVQSTLATGDRSEREQKFRRVTVTLIALGVLVGGILAFFGDSATRLLFGAQLASPPGFFLPLALAYVAVSMSTAFGRLAISAFGGHASLFSATLTAAVFGLPAMFVCALIWGATGLLWAFAGSEFLVVAIQVAHLRRHLKESVRL